MKRAITIDEVLELRKQVVLCSLYYADYRNDIGVEEHECCDFFDGYAEYLGELMEEDGISDNEYFDHVGLYDNDENLIAWFYCFENALECRLMVEEEEEEEEDIFLW